MKDSLRRESVVDIQHDGDPYWFNNPQFRLTIDEPTEVGNFCILSWLMFCVIDTYLELCVNGAC